jgi:hypothetical protein
MRWAIPVAAERQRVAKFPRREGVLSCHADIFVAQTVRERIARARAIRNWLIRVEQR